MMVEYDPEVFASTFTTLGTSTLALILRLIAWRMIRISLLYDDYLAVVAFVRDFS